MFNKKYIQEIEKLNNKINELQNQLLIEKSNTHSLSESNNSNILKLNNTITNLKKQLEKYQSDFDLKQTLENLSVSKESLSKTIIELNNKQLELNNLRQEIIEVSNKINLQSFGMYETVFPKRSSQDYKDEISSIKSIRENMLQQKTYYNINSPWIYNGNEYQGNKLMEFFAKTCITSFNLSIDSITDRLTVINVEKSKKKAKNIFNNLYNELSKHDIILNNKYLDLVLKELDYKYKLEIKLKQEKEERDHEKELLKEQLKAEKELEEQRKKLETERNKYLKNTDEESIKKIEEINELIIKNEYCLKNQKCGYIYIISNPSLGKDVYKIGLTRRINNMAEERIRELSGSNVPFIFSPNCILWSDDVFKLESNLHKEFSQYKLNKVKSHREFFKIPLEKIENVIKEKYCSDAIFDYEIIDEDFILSGLEL